MQSVTHTTSPVYLRGEIPFRYFAFLCKSHLPPESHFLLGTKVIAAPVVLSALTFSSQEALLKLTATVYIYMFSLCFLALLPPVNRIRPRSPPPPPPPTNSADAKSSKSIPSPPKVVEQLEKCKEVKKVVKPTPFYENAAFHNKPEAASSVSVTPQHPPRRSGTVNLIFKGTLSKFELN